MKNIYPELGWEFMLGSLNIKMARLEEDDSFG